MKEDLKELEQKQKDQEDAMTARIKQLESEKLLLQGSMTQSVVRIIPPLPLQQLGFFTLASSSFFLCIFFYSMAVKRQSLSGG